MLALMRLRLHLFPQTSITAQLEALFPSLLDRACHGELGGLPAAGTSAR
jgi:hypothetical protein